MLHVLMNMHHYTFKEEKLKKMEKTGWAQVQAVNNPQAYKDSSITDESEKRPENSNVMYSFKHRETARAENLKRWNQLGTSDTSPDTSPDTSKLSRKRTPKSSASGAEKKAKRK